MKLLKKDWEGRSTFRLKSEKEKTRYNSNVAVIGTLTIGPPYTRQSFNRDFPRGQVIYYGTIWTLLNQHHWTIKIKG
jgi:hypothetical protein